MATRISISDLSSHLDDVIERVRAHRERFAIEQAGEEVALLEPVQAPTGATWADLAERLRSHVGESDFADDLEAIQQGQPDADLAPWPNS